jgi:hypothetical protein
MPNVPPYITMCVHLSINATWLRGVSGIIGQRHRKKITTMSVDVKG